MKHLYGISFGQGRGRFFYFQHRKAGKTQFTDSNPAKVRAPPPRTPTAQSEERMAGQPHPKSKQNTVLTKGKATDKLL